MEYKQYPGVHGKIPAHLPKRLTIGFPLWTLADNDPNGPCHDLKKLVEEHVERGYNCLRVESGAGLVHDLDGNRLPPIQLYSTFPGYSENRLSVKMGVGGPCDMLQRLIELCTECKKQGVYVILSSWYFLHTYWCCDNETNHRLFSIGPQEWFMAFAKFLHYILKELEERDLADRVISAEIFNEVNWLPMFWCQYPEYCSYSEATIMTFFREKHEEALAFLQKEHPDIIFACDDSPRSEMICVNPRNMQCYNGHVYYLWDVYGGALEKCGGETSYTNRGDFFLGKIKPEDVANSRAGRWKNSAIDWIYRLMYLNDVDPQKIPAMEEYLENRLNEKWDDYMQGLENSIYWFKRIMEEHPDIPVMCGEGGSWYGNPDVQWENKSQRYWEFIEHAMTRFKEIGLWGTVVKTCCSPEDPCWITCKDKILELNIKFLSD